jgi:hypothetical protein
MADWVTISSLATAGGTLVLAVATFASVRSANRAARVAEISVMAGLRPLLMHSRLDDPTLKVGFQDGKWFHVAGGQGAAEANDEAVYIVMSMRNAGTGLAVLHGWWFAEEALAGVTEAPPLDEMHRLTRDIFVPPNDVGFWQGSFRDPASDEYATARRVIEARQPFGIAVMYGDVEGGQRAITRFGVFPTETGWLVTAGRVWNVDRNDPR